MVNNLKATAETFLKNSSSGILRFLWYVQLTEDFLPWLPASVNLSTLLRCSAIEIEQVFNHTYIGSRNFYKLKLLVSPCPNFTIPFHHFSQMVRMRDSMTHCFLNWSRIEPLKRKDVHMRRGTSPLLGSVQCGHQIARFETLFLCQCAS